MAAKRSAAKTDSRRASAKQPRKRSERSARNASVNRPSFPYTTRPNALRRFLDEVPRRPRPPRVNAELLASWGLGGGENNTIIRVLKALGLVNSNNEPTDAYTAFMRAGAGPSVLGGLIRDAYAPLFAASHEPHREPNESLRNLFNIHSSGAAGTIDYQIQTFKALSDYAAFDGNGGAVAGTPSAASAVGTSPAAASSPTDTAGGQPMIHIDLHIHLPENKTSRDYEYIIQDIARFIYGRVATGPTERDGRG